MTTNSESELPETPAEEKDLVGIATHALFGCPMSSEEAHSKIYGDYKAWEREWMAGNTEWWPDTIDLPGDAEQVIRSGCPSSPMPKKAQERIQKLRDAGEIYVTHVASGVHAYRIGLVSEYVPNVKVMAPPRRSLKTKKELNGGCHARLVVLLHFGKDGTPNTLTSSGNGCIGQGWSKHCSLVRWLEGCWCWRWCGYSLPAATKNGKIRTQPRHQAR